MRKTLILLLTLLVMASCSDPNARYVKKAVRIMDKHGIYAQGPEWEKAKQEAFSAKPSSLDEAQEVVIGVARFYGSVATLVAVQDFFVVHCNFSVFSATNGANKES